MKNNATSLNDTSYNYRFTINPDIVNVIDNDNHASLI